MDCVVFDIDGVLSDGSRRFAEVFEGCDKPGWVGDWDKFYAEMDDDLPIKVWVNMIRLLHRVNQCRIILLTNRPEVYRVRTLLWLKQHGIPHHELIMKSAESGYEHSKRYHLMRILRDGYTIHAFIDDDPMHEPIATELNIPFIYVHSRYMEPIMNARFH